MQTPNKIIDIDKAFADKNPQLFKMLPKFILNWIKKIIHQDDINQHLAENIKLDGMQYSAAAVERLGAKRLSRGIENIPKTGGVIIASNHPLGGVDGMALIAEVAKVRQDIKFIVNDLLMQFPQFEDVFIPVNKLGTNTKTNLERIERYYSEGRCMIIFPAGLCSRKQGGQILDLKWHKSFLSRALKYNLPIIPTFIDAKNSNRFYNLANIRKSLGIKANIEMFFLHDEMFKQNGKTIEITFGKPIEAKDIDKSYTLENWAQIIKLYIYTLKQKPLNDFSLYLKHSK